MAPAKAQRSRSQSSPGNTKPAARRKRRAAPAIALTPEEQLEAYRMMLLIRRFEEKAGQLWGCRPG
jgi:pyruvate dehydrogenase E1 component alpha subunit